MGGMHVFHVFLTSALVGGERSPSRPGRFISGGKSRGTPWIGGWMGLRIGLDDVEKRKIFPLPGLELQPLSRLGGNQSLYLLRYPSTYLK
jgi:hypothetical protein